MNNAKKQDLIENENFWLFDDGSEFLDRYILVTKQNHAYRISDSRSAFADGGHFGQEECSPTHVEECREKYTEIDKAGFDKMSDYFKELVEDLVLQDQINTYEEQILDDNHPVFWDYLYVADGKIVRSDVKGTVATLKRDLRTLGRKAKIITSCNIAMRSKDTEKLF